MAVALTLAACGGEPALDDTGTRLEPGKALVVFLRKPKLPGTSSSPRTSLFLVHADGEGQDFIGILDKGGKVAYSVDPGDHLFMIVGESADFLEAHLDAGKIYYAVAEKRVGIWRPRYSLWPVSKNQDSKLSVNVEDMAKLRRKCEWSDVSNRDRDWYAANKHSVDSKRAGYLRKWNAREEEGVEHPTLNREDGF